MTHSFEKLNGKKVRLLLSVKWSLEPVTYRIPEERGIIWSMVEKRSQWGRLKLGL